MSIGYVSRALKPNKLSIIMFIKFISINNTFSKAEPRVLEKHRTIVKFTLSYESSC